MPLHYTSELAARLWSGALADDSGCWIWQRVRHAGYGRISFNGKSLLTHRVAYELVKGPIPPGLEIDHLCRVPSCINPDHLEAVTHRENIWRGLKGALTTHCPQDHPYDEENTYTSPAGRRRCRACHREESRKRFKEAIR